ncbi:MAG TPA: hypothetical protein VMJ10_26495 [Kofleriaceae bacterium]|nr:hypothetical protein [Kofleriaceae bacterium]
MRRISIVFALGPLVLGCGNTEHRAPAAATPHAMAQQTYPLPGASNGLLWDDRARALYVTDDSHDQLLEWTDAAGFHPVGLFPTSPAGIGLGAIVRRTDGSFIVPSFGFGKDGTIFTLAGDGKSLAYAGLDPARRRIALAIGPDGQVYESYFVVGEDKKHTGGVARVSFDGANATETPIQTTVTLDKVVGIAATATSLFACDQGAGQVDAITLADGTTTSIAKPPSCDQLLLLPHGDLVTGGASGAVYRITTAGNVTTIASGFGQVRGLAFDTSGRRLFFVEHFKGADSHDQLHVIPFDEH